MTELLMAAKHQKGGHAMSSTTLPIPHPQPGICTTINRLSAVQTPALDLAFTRIQPLCTRGRWKAHRYRRGLVGFQRHGIIVRHVHPAAVENCVEHHGVVQCEIGAQGLDFKLQTLCDPSPQHFGSAIIASTSGNTSSTALYHKYA